MPDGPRATRKIAGAFSIPVALISFALISIWVKDGWLTDGDGEHPGWDVDVSGWRGVRVTQSLVFVYEAAALMLIAVAVAREHASTDGVSSKSVDGRKLCFLASPVLQSLVVAHVWFDVVSRNILLVLLVGGVHLLLLLYTVRVAVRVGGAAECVVSAAMLGAFAALYVPAAVWYEDNMV